MFRLLLPCMILLVFIVPVSFAQIPNAGFETWTAGSPDGWSTNNAGPYSPVTQSTTAHGGSSAVRGDVISAFSVVFQPILQVGPAGGGFAFTGRPAIFTGYYQFNPVSGDRLSIAVLLMKGGINGTPVGGGTLAITDAATSWSAFNLPIPYLTADAPDLCEIAIEIIGSGTGSSAAAHAGSYFLVDDISFSGTATGIAQDGSSQPNTFRLDQNYPNPFNPSTVIGFTVPTRAFTRLAVYNSLGQEVALLANAEMAEGYHSAVFDAGNLPSGVYYYRLTAGASSITRKLMVLK